jgi:hypothetical protein
MNILVLLILMQSMILKIFFSNFKEYFMFEKNRLSNSVINSNFFVLKRKAFKIYERFDFLWIKNIFNTINNEKLIIHSNMIKEILRTEIQHHKTWIWGIGKFELHIYSKMKEEGRNWQHKDEDILEVIDLNYHIWIF